VPIPAKTTTISIRPYPQTLLHFIQQAACKKQEKDKQLSKAASAGSTV
jgi:hypothetical protein